MTKNDVKDVVLAIAFVGLLGANVAAGYKSYRFAKKSAEFKEPVEEDAKKAFNSLREEKRVAYYIQKSGIKMDGSITKPKYFGKLPAEYKILIIDIKDLYKEDLKYYLKMNVDREEVLVFERELADMNKPEFIDASYQR